MTSRWPLFRRSEADQSARRGNESRAQDTAVAAFLDMDRRQSIASTAVDASVQLFPEHAIAAAWAPVEAQCFAAGAQYLAATDQFDGKSSPPAENAFASAAHTLGVASQAVDAFYDKHRPHLEHAASVLGAIPAQAQQAMNEAQSARRDMDALGVDSRGTELSRYPSVRSHSAQLDGAEAALGNARASGSAVAVRAAAAHVLEAAHELRDAAKAAPSRGQEARTALSSVKTRIQAVRLRSERIGPASSALLREFNAASSKDLSNNERESATHIAHAESDLEAAGHAQNPEEILAFIASARRHLKDAEALVDAVTDRLDVLRTARSDPRAAEDTVRFTLRDAQLLAINRGLVAEWGSVLDAQLARIDRASGKLTGPHPDYWTYLQELESISTFIAGIIQRMRGL